MFRHPNLQFWLPADNSSPNDKAQNGYTGTVSNYSYTTGIAGGAISASSTTGYIDYSTAAALNFERTDKFSFSMWIKGSTPSLNACLAMRMSAAGTIGWIISPRTNSRLAFMFSSSWGPSWIYIDIPFTFSNTVWKHICITYDGSSNANGVKVYVNGVSQTVTINGNNLTTSTVTSSGSLRIGYSSVGYNTFIGAIENFQIYKGIVLTAKDVARIMAGLHPLTRS